MRPPAPRPELIWAWHRSDDLSTASGSSRVKARAGCAGASPALTPSRPDAVPLRSDRRPGLPRRKRLPGEDPAVPAQSRVPLRRKRPAGTQGGGDIDEPSVVTERSRSIGNHAASEIDAPGPCLTPTCGGRTRRPRTEEWPLPDDHPRSQRQLGVLDPRSPITEEGLTTVPLPPPVSSLGTFFFRRSPAARTTQSAGLRVICPNHARRPTDPF
jgi:hypothetical protein